MQGPAAKGHWTGAAEPLAYGGLMPGHSYEVAKAFRDYDGDLHPQGERWRYLTYSFLPYDDGLSLFVAITPDQEWHIRLQDRPEEQGEIVRHLSDYIAPDLDTAPQIALLLPSEWARTRSQRTFRALGAAAGVLILLPIAAIGAAAVPGLLLAWAWSVVAAGVAGWFVAGKIWAKRRLQEVRGTFPPGIDAAAVARWIGAPRQDLDLFPGDIMRRMIYPPETILAGVPLGIMLAFDFDSRDRLVSVEPLR
ncbi:DUF3601 domain-containing protein [Sphingomonas sp.]|uniref:DUF3601 domain-containing protein n=1 Tax=Sphingomonas sp. TaxID=28214 RepID=UPI003B3B8BC0